MKEAPFKSLPPYIVAIIILHESNILEGIQAVIFPSDFIIGDNGDMFFECVVFTFKLYWNIFRRSLRELQKMD